MNTASPTIMTRLREETRVAHETAEKTDFQQALAAGRLPLDRYVDGLEQLLCVHRELERRLRTRRDADPASASILRDELLQEENLRADLAHFGRDPDAVRPGRAAEALLADIDRLDATDPTALLGMYYVLEGSKNGARFLAPRVRAAYDLTGAGGTRALDPHGPRQRELWQQFKQSMESAGFAGAAADGIVAAAMRMFAGITEIYRELSAAARAADAPARQGQTIAFTND